MGTTLYDKLFDEHIVHEEDDGTVLLYIDRHLINEVTSPQAFESLRLRGQPVWNPGSAMAVADHNVPTTGSRTAISDPLSATQVAALTENCVKASIPIFDLTSPVQGIVHVVGPETGATLPGMTIVCGDSHTSTHGALGALAFGIGTSDVEHVLATQTLVTRRSATMRVWLNGSTMQWVSAKDVALSIIRRLGTSGGTGYAIEFAGGYVEALSMEARMTLCNMAIEAGARAGLIAVDDTTLAYCRGRRYAPTGEMRVQAEEYWRSLRSDDDARFDKELVVDVSEIRPQVSWGTTPDMVIAVDEAVPGPSDAKDADTAKAWQRALEYMGLSPGVTPLEVTIDKVFIGSCTNSRIEDLRVAATVVRLLGTRIADEVKLALVVPGSQAVKRQAEQEGLDRIFTEAGFEWRDSGCSMCLAMNADRLEPGERVASTSNRNFEGRQGAGGRTHLVSPAMAAAAAIAGKFVDVHRLLSSGHGQS